MKLGSTVTLTYTGKLDDGTVFGFATADEPMKFQTGMDMTIDGFEAAILEMNEVGEKKTFTVGEYDATASTLTTSSRASLWSRSPVRHELKVGKRIWMSNSKDGDPTPATIIEIDKEQGEVVFDLNHPLAGKQLTFEVEILEIEDAPENFVSAREKAEHLKEQGKLLGGDQGESYR